MKRTMSFLFVHSFVSPLNNTSLNGNAVTNEMFKVQLT